MATNYKKITISIPIELDRLLDKVIEQSKKTESPLTKSGIVSDLLTEFIRNCLAILDSQKKPDKGGKA